MHTISWAMAKKNPKSNQQSKITIIIKCTKIKFFIYKELEIYTNKKMLKKEKNQKKLFSNFFFSL